MIRSRRTALRRWLFPISLLLLFMHCDHSSLSSGAVTDPAQLRVNVAITRLADYDSRVNERIEAFIRDEAGKPVANAQIQVKVNGNALTLNNGSSNYYGAYPYYQLTDSTVDIGPGASCTVTVVLTDGSEYILGTIQTQPALTPAQFSPPIIHARRQPLTLTWQDMEPHHWLVSQWKRWQGESSATELKLSKSIRTVDRWKNVRYEGGSADAADYRTISVGSGSGVYTIPVSYFEGPQKQFNTLDVQVNSEKRLETDNPFLKGSTISSSCSSLYRIEVTD